MITAGFPPVAAACAYTRHKPARPPPTINSIATAAANTLRWHVATCTADIRPVVQDGWITLKGHVPFAFQKVAAEQVLRNLVGVRMIVNDLSVGGVMSAGEVKQSILAAFRRLAIHESNDIEVMVDIPTVTLRGHVSNLREREDAARAACAAPGVTQVENRLFVT
jgi:osmotically-inducible protein OsmY